MSWEVGKGKTFFLSAVNQWGGGVQSMEGEEEEDEEIGT